LFLARYGVRQPAEVAAKQLWPVGQDEWIVLTVPRPPGSEREKFTTQHGERDQNNDPRESPP
jgi:hypothetical protein